MKINNMSQLMQGELRKADANSRKTEREHANGNKNAAASPKDRSELSADGQKRRAVESDVAMIASMVKAQPDIRAERVALAESRLNSGFYNTDDFVAKLASKLAPAFA